MQKDKKMDPQRTIVLYTSKYGAAETYAQWIAEALGCQAVSLDKFSKKELQGYDTVIYGGGVQAGGESGAAPPAQRRRIWRKIGGLRGILGAGRYGTV